MVAIVNLVLSFHVMPIFVEKSIRAVKADAKQILFRNIQERGYYKLPSDKDRQYLLYADDADPQNDTLLGTVVVEMKAGQIKKIITAESARVYFNPHRKFNEVQITAYNVYQMGTADEGGFSAEWLPLTMEFGSLLGDDIKFKKLDEMKRIRDVDLMLFYPIAELANKVYAQFTTELLVMIPIVFINCTVVRSLSNLLPATAVRQMREQSGYPEKLWSWKRMLTVKKLCEHCDAKRLCCISKARNQHLR